MENTFLLKLDDYRCSKWLPMWVHSTTGSIISSKQSRWGDWPYEDVNKPALRWMQPVPGIPLKYYLFFFSAYYTSGYNQATNIAIISSSRHWKTVVKYPQAETQQNMQVNCWTLDLYPQFCGIASVWYRVSEAVCSFVQYWMNATSCFSVA